ncbi:MAG TPA: DUF1761 domain-containing protein [Candidatus Nanoarchaeia archaeon]|nr:DUF1761 domain-containing protein [Candidatus Nanoarchaeia archaeon]
MNALGVNLWAVLVAAVVSTAIGMVWYSPFVFGKKWSKLSGFTAKQTKEMKKGAGKSHAIQFVATLVMAFVLALIINIAEPSKFADGAAVGFWMWLGFVATVSLGRVLWENASVKLFLMNVGFNLVSIAVMGGILATLR